VTELKILIVEDDAEKLKQVAQHLIEACNVASDDIQDVRDATAAKRALKVTSFDLLILDIKIPARMDADALIETGLGLLRELVSRDVYKRPMHIVGLTALEDAHRLAAPEFSELSFSLVSYDRSSEGWKTNIQRVCEHISAGEFTAPTKRDYESDVCIVAALHDPELKAVLTLPWQWEADEKIDDNLVYYHGAISSGEKTLKVIAASCPRMGMPAAAIVASRMIERFRPRYIIMVGILAGVGDALNLGDVLVADPTWDYENGKREVDDGEQTFAAAPHQLALDPELRARTDQLISDQEFLDQVRRDWMGTRVNHALGARRGPVASGGAVLQDPSIVEQVKAQHRKLIGIEMESYAVMLAANEAAHPRPKAVSLKAVCDFADKDKNDDYQAYASYTSARLMAELVTKYLDFEGQ
jgi:nucleoside phosphorylase